MNNYGHGRNHSRLAYLDHRRDPLNDPALVATFHCLIGCSIGEVIGLSIGAACGWGNASTIALAVVLAFVSGFALTAWPLLRRSYPMAVAFRIALAADAASITIMEIIDNMIMLAIPGAMNVSIGSMRFWASTLLSLIVAGIVAYPVNHWLITKGKGHAHVHH
jgi:hypothetical protein